MGGEGSVGSWSCLRWVASATRDSSSLRRATTERFLRMVSNSLCFCLGVVSRSLVSAREGRVGVGEGRKRTFHNPPNRSTICRWTNSSVPGALIAMVGKQLAKLSLLILSRVCFAVEAKRACSREARGPGMRGTRFSGAGVDSGSASVGSVGGGASGDLVDGDCAGSVSTRAGACCISVSWFGSCCCCGAAGGGSCPLDMMIV